MKKLRQIPSLTEASLNIVYNTPLNVKPSETKYKNSSLFNDELGNVSAPNSLIGRAFPVFNFLNSYLDTTLHAIQLFASQNNIKS